MQDRKHSSEQGLGLLKESERKGNYIATFLILYFR
jgi:hypothetical protein